MVIRYEVKRLPHFLKADGRLHRAEIVADVEFSARLKTGEDAHGAECGFPERMRSSGDEFPQISEKSAFTISTHFTPGITLRSIWFIT